GGLARRGARRRARPLRQAAAAGNARIHPEVYDPEQAEHGITGRRVRPESARHRCRSRAHARLPSARVDDCESAAGRGVGLNRKFADHHVLVMREQHFAPEQFVAAAKLFGELLPHDKKERHVPGHPDVEYISNEEFVDGKRIIPGETFHTDHSNHPRPPKATTLFAVELPSSGGDTQYVNMHDAYEDLPEDTKRRIDGLKAVHVYLSKYSPRSLGHLTEESRRNLPPPAIHPLVHTH